jgi:hypothetical protein
MLPIAFDQKGMIDFDYWVENPIVPMFHSHSNVLEEKQHLCLISLRT